MEKIAVSGKSTPPVSTSSKLESPPRSPSHSTQSPVRSPSHSTNSPVRSPSHSTQSPARSPSHKEEIPEEEKYVDDLIDRGPPDVFKTANGSQRAISRKTTRLMLSEHPGKRPLAKILQKMKKHMEKKDPGSKELWSCQSCFFEQNRDDEYVCKMCGARRLKERPEPTKGFAFARFKAAGKETLLIKLSSKSSRATTSNGEEKRDSEDEESSSENEKVKEPKPPSLLEVASREANKLEEALKKAKKLSQENSLQKRFAKWKKRANLTEAELSLQMKKLHKPMWKWYKKDQQEDVRNKFGRFPLFSRGLKEWSPWWKVEDLYSKHIERVQEMKVIHENLKQWYNQPGPAHKQMRKQNGSIPDFWEELEDWKPYDDVVAVYKCTLAALSHIFPSLCTWYYRPDHRNKVPFLCRSSRTNQIFGEFPYDAEVAITFFGEAAIDDDHHGIPKKTILKFVPNTETVFTNNEDRSRAAILIQRRVRGHQLRKTRKMVLPKLRESSTEKEVEEKKDQDANPAEEAGIVNGSSIDMEEKLVDDSKYKDFTKSEIILNLGPNAMKAIMLHWEFFDEILQRYKHYLKWSASSEESELLNLLESHKHRKRHANEDSDDVDDFRDSQNENSEHSSFEDEDGNDKSTENSEDEKGEDEIVKEKLPDKKAMRLQMLKQNAALIGAKKPGGASILATLATRQLDIASVALTQPKSERSVEGLVMLATFLKTSMSKTKLLLQKLQEQQAWVHVARVVDCTSYESGDVIFTVPQESDVYFIVLRGEAALCKEDQSMKSENTKDGGVAGGGASRSKKKTLEELMQAERAKSNSLSHRILRRSKSTMVEERKGKGSSVNNRVLRRSKSIMTDESSTSLNNRVLRRSKSTMMPSPFLSTFENSKSPSEEEILQKFEVGTSIDHRSAWESWSGEAKRFVATKRGTLILHISGKKLLRILQEQHTAMDAEVQKKKIRQNTNVSTSRLSQTFRLKIRKRTKKANTTGWRNDPSTFPSMSLF
eukprot:g281.t1